MVAEQLTLSGVSDFERICAHWAANHPKYLAHLRELAVAIARNRGEVTIDELREQMATYKVPFPKEIGADDRLFGSVLRGDSRLTAVGNRRTRRDEWAKRVGTNRNLVTVYALRENAI